MESLHPGHQSGKVRYKQSARLDVRLAVPKSPTRCWPISVVDTVRVHAESYNLLRPTRRTKLMAMCGLAWVAFSVTSPMQGPPRPSGAGEQSTRSSNRQGRVFWPSFRLPRMTSPSSTPGEARPVRGVSMSDRAGWSLGSDSLGPDRRRDKPHHLPRQSRTRPRSHGRQVQLLEAPYQQ